MIGVVDEDDEDTDLGLDVSSVDNGSATVIVGAGAGADKALGAVGEPGCAATRIHIFCSRRVLMHARPSH